MLADVDKTIAKAPGIGKKTAQRLIIELKDKLSLADTFVEQEARELASGAGAQGTVRQEAVEALVALGYSSGEAMKAVNGVEISEETTVEEVLKASLRQMSLL